MLSDFGLTMNQAKVYAATVRLRLASMAQISRVSGVRREDVYRMLPKLDEIGLVERAVGIPTKVRARPVEEALSILMKTEQENAKKRMEELGKKKSSILEYFNTTRQQPPLEEQRPDFALLAGKEEAARKARSMIRDSEREIDLVGPEQALLQFVPMIKEPLGRAMRNSSKMRIVCEACGKEYLLPKFLEEHSRFNESIDVRHASTPIFQYLIVDSVQALVGTWREGNMTEFPCLWTSSDTLVDLLRSDFESLWHNSVR